MSLDPTDPRLTALADRTTPYAWSTVVRAAERALAIHADEVGPEHLLGALMADPDSAAHAVVLHAFADPETIEDEALAISPGLLVVASDSTLPFSPLAVEALRRARSAAAAARAAEVTTARVLLESGAALPGEVAGDLARSGYRPEVLGEEVGAPAAEPVPAEGSLFARFSHSAKRAVSQANRLAAGVRARSIGPAHLALACLRVDEALAERAGVSFLQARAAIAGRTVDDSAPIPRPLPPDEGLVEFLERLPSRSGTLAVLAGFHSAETPELAQILIRHKVTTSLLERSQGAFRDPEGP